MSPAKEKVEAALREVIDRDSGADVMTSGMISGLSVEGGKVAMLITINPADRQKKQYLEAACTEKVKAIPGVTSVTAVLTAHSDSESSSPAARKPAQWHREPLPYVRKIIAVASGKGGVGKSTTAVNLAHALVRSGKRAGLLDADIYGPSIPRMMGLMNAPQPEIADGKMQPPRARGIPCMSMGFITGDQAAVLRGPMISKTLQQLLRFTAWGTEKEPLDVLLVDMPPGTGDIHLSMAQQVPLDGAIIVTTPQEVAVMDARKCLQMFLKVNVPILGVIENMSGDLFGNGGGKKLAEETGAPFLGEIRADIAVREASDGGNAYNGRAAVIYSEIAEKL